MTRVLSLAAIAFILLAAPVSDAVAGRPTAGGATMADKARQGKGPRLVVRTQATQIEQVRLGKDRTHYNAAMRVRLKGQTKDVARVRYEFSERQYIGTAMSGSRIETADWLHGFGLAYTQGFMDNDSGSLTIKDPQRIKATVTFKDGSAVELDGISAPDLVKAFPTVLIRGDVEQNSTIEHLREGAKLARPAREREIDRNWEARMDRYRASQQRPATTP